MAVLKEETSKEKAMHTVPAPLPIRKHDLLFGPIVDEINKRYYRKCKTSDKHSAYFGTIGGKPREFKDTYNVEVSRLPAGVEITVSPEESLNGFSVVSGFVEVPNRAVLSGAKLGDDLHSFNGRKLYLFSGFEDIMNNIQSAEAEERVFVFTRHEGEEQKHVTVSYNPFEKMGMELSLQFPKGNIAITSLIPLKGALEAASDIALNDLILEINGQSMYNKTLAVVKYQ